MNPARKIFYLVLFNFISQHYQTSFNSQLASLLKMVIHCHSVALSFIVIRLSIDKEIIYIITQPAFLCQSRNFCTTNHNVKIEISNYDKNHLKQRKSSALFNKNWPNLPFSVLVHLTLISHSLSTLKMFNTIKRKKCVHIPKKSSIHLWYNSKKQHLFHRVKIFSFIVPSEFTIIKRRVLYPYFSII